MPKKKTTPEGWSNQLLNQEAKPTRPQKKKRKKATQKRKTKKKTTTTTKKTPQKAVKGPKRAKFTRMAVSVPVDFPERIKNAAFWLRIPVAQIVTKGVETELRKLEKKHNGGKPYQKRSKNLKAGRPIKVE